MKRRTFVLGSVAAIGGGAFGQNRPNPPSAGRVVTKLDSGWRFFRGDVAGAEAPNFADSGWQTVRVPHDWSIAGPFDAKNPSGGGGGFLPGGIGWYRKRFDLVGDIGASVIWVEFDGIMANSDVWINGVHLGHRPNGYVGLRYDLTPHLKPTGNVLAVRADNAAQPASRWYTGAGIYRHVRLVSVNATGYLAPDSLIVTTDGDNVRVRGAIRGKFRQYFVQLSGPDGKAMMSATPDTPGFDVTLHVPNAQRWEIDRPTLYRIDVGVDGGRDAGTAFGFRDFRFEPATGFWLNGKNLKIKGVCLHQDAGAFGAAVPLSIWQNRLATLKSLGVNAVRTAHHPFAPEFLDLCDRIGLLVLDELFDAWTVGKAAFDYHVDFEKWATIDTTDVIVRDRNHPGVIAYSIGNEIRDTPNAEAAKRNLTRLRDAVHAADPTRPVTMALFRPNASHDYDNGLADLLDVIGQNYRENEILAAHAAKPSRKILGTENGHDRRVWLALRDNPAYAGQFLWTGIDYLGESRRWPIVGAGSGLLDRTGEPKPIAFERQSWWSDAPMVFAARRVAAPRLTPDDPGFEPLNRPPTVFADWSPANREPHDETVEVFSNCADVELFLNDRSLGSLPRPADASPRVWTVPFAPGTLRAVGRSGGGGKTVAEHTLRTAGKPAKIVLTLATSTRPRVDPDDVAIVRAAVTDASGVPIPDATDTITFRVDGPGILAGVDNGDNTSHEPFFATQRAAYLGRCTAFVRATAASGTITITASAPGLAAGSARIGSGDVAAKADTEPVTLTEDAETFTLANGVVTAKIAKRSGDLISLVYQNHETLGDASGHPFGYWSHAPSGPGSVASVTIDPKTNVGARAEVSVKRAYAGTPLGSGPGGSVAADIEVRYALGQGDSGVYTYSIFDHKPTYPATAIGEARFALKLSDGLFDFMTVDANRRKVMISGSDWARGTTLDMKEVRRMNTGIYKGQVEHKYDYSAVQFETPAIGWSSTRYRVGIWIVNPTIEYLSGGPTKVELNAHRDATFGSDPSAGSAPTLLNYWRGSHYGGTQCVIGAGEAWSKVVGPFLIYCNAGQSHEAMWKDALAKADAESKRWPYDWVNGVDYPKRAERGSVRGKIVLDDLPTAKMSNLLVGLASAADWQTDAKAYQFWTRGDRNGDFTISNVRPGTYTLFAIADGVLGEFSKTDVTVAAGQPLALGALTWRPERTGRPLWEIGVPDRTAAEFRHGDHYWQWGLPALYPKEFPNDVRFVIGKSDPRTDWNFCQPPRGDGTETTWTVAFDLAEVPTKRATLRLAFAGSSAKTVRVSVNGAPAGSTGPLPDTGVLRRDGIRGLWFERRVAFDPALLKRGANTLQLTIPPGGPTSGVLYDYLPLEGE